MPRLDRLISGKDFDPETDEASFRIVATDHASHLVCPHLCRMTLPSARHVSFHFLPLYDAQFDATERGRVDLLIVADDGTAPSHFAREVIFDVGFVCVVAKDSPFKRAVTMKQYLAADHIGIDIVGGIQTIPEKRLTAIGAKRHCPIVMPYHTAALKSLVGTNLIATVPRRIADLEASNPALRIIRAPRVLGTFKYLMAWHPRLNTDSAHIWLRSIVRRAGNAIANE